MNYKTGDILFWYDNKNRLFVREYILNYNINGNGLLYCCDLDILDNLNPNICNPKESIARHLRIINWED